MGAMQCQSLVGSKRPGMTLDATSGAKGVPSEEKLTDDFPEDQR
jgi:hypothetical protein